MVLSTVLKSRVRGGVESVAVLLPGLRGRGVVAGVTLPRPARSRTVSYSSRTCSSSVTKLRGSGMGSRCSHSPFTCEKRDSIQAWPLGVAVRSAAWSRRLP